MGVASVFDFHVCLSVLCLLVSKFSNWPAPSSIHRGLEWPQCLNSMSVCLFFVCLSANFLIFSSFILLFLYSTVQKSAVQYSYLLASSLEYPERIRVVSVFETLVCSLSAVTLFYS